MRLTQVMVACILAVSGAGVALAQGVEPLKVLEKERRDRLETDQRIAREAQGRRLKEIADQVAKAEAQRKLEKEAAALGASTPLEIRASDRQPVTSAPGLEVGAPLPPHAPTGTPGAVVPSTAQPPTPPGVKADMAPPAPPATRVLITIDKAAQRMLVTVGGRLRHSWPVSTGREQFETPTGTFRPLRLAREHYSKEWDDAPMPHSIFFTSRGHAIHGTNDTRRLGRRASHGCVRLAPSKAAALFALVQAEGPSATKVTVTGGDTAKAARIAGRSPKREASTSRIDPVRRVSPDSWLIGPGDDWFD